MAKGLITQQILEDIADAIRGRNNSVTEYKPSEMAAAVAAIPNSYAVADEGKVVSNGALVAQTARATAITENGTFDTTENNSVTVSVSGGGSGKHIVTGAGTVISTNSGERTPVLKTSEGASACIICYNAGGSGSGGNWTIVFSVAETEEDAKIYYPSSGNTGASSSFTYNGHTYYFSTVATNSRWGGATDMTNPLDLPTITGIQMMDVANNTLTNYGQAILSLLMEV